MRTRAATEEVVDLWARVRITDELPIVRTKCQPPAHQVQKSTLFVKQFPKTPDNKSDTWWMRAGVEPTVGSSRGAGRQA